jgi:hypothetical protein
MATKFPQKKRWVKLLKIHFPVDFSEKLIVSANQHYRCLLLDKSNQNTQHHAIIRNRIFPILAIYRAMQDQAMEQNSALEKLEYLLIEIYLRTQLNGIRFLNRVLIDPFPLIKPFLRSMMRFSDLPHGQEIRRDDPDCFAIDIHQCFIHDTLIAFNARELTQIFCSSDDRLSEAMPKIE